MTCPACGANAGKIMSTTEGVASLAQARRIRTCEALSLPQNKLQRLQPEQRAEALNKAKR